MSDQQTPDGGKRWVYKLPPVLRRAIAAFDRGEQVAPLRFTLRRRSRSE